MARFLTASTNERGGVDAAANFDDLAIVNYRDFDVQVSVIYRYCPRLTAGKGEFLS